MERARARAREPVERLEGESQFASIAFQPKYFKKKISVMFTGKKPVNITDNLKKFQKKMLGQNPKHLLKPKSQIKKQIFRQKFLTKYLFKYFLYKLYFFIFLYKYFERWKAVEIGIRLQTFEQIFEQFIVIVRKRDCSVSKIFKKNFRFVTNK